MQRFQWMALYVVFIAAALVWLIATVAAGRAQ